MPWPRKDKLQFTCLRCSANFEVYPSYVRPLRSPPRYCSRTCYATHYQSIHGGMNRKTGTMRHKGYVLAWAPKHPSNVKGYVPQHRLIVEAEIGRLLRPDEEVHHKNYIRDDNTLDNLELLTTIEHRELHGKEKKKLITVDGVAASFQEWAALLSRDYSWMKKLRKSRGWTSEETVRYFKDKSRK